MTHRYVFVFEVMGWGFVCLGGLVGVSVVGV